MSHNSRRISLKIKRVRDPGVVVVVVVGHGVI